VQTEARSNIINPQFLVSINNK